MNRTHACKVGRKCASLLAQHQLAPRKRFHSVTCRFLDVSARQRSRSVNHGTSERLGQLASSLVDTGACLSTILLEVVVVEIFDEVRRG